MLLAGSQAPAREPAKTSRNGISVNAVSLSLLEAGVGIEARLLPGPGVALHWFALHLLIALTPGWGKRSKLLETVQEQTHLFTPSPHSSPD